MSDEIKFTIATTQKFRPLRAVYFASWMVGVIGVGVVAGSDAMQWAGFAMLGLIAVVGVAAHGRSDTGLSIDEARRRIDEIEASQSR